jgi:DNA-binding transcriptional MerR regulator
LTLTLADLARLQEILVWRALGFSLHAIRAMLDDPAYDRIGALRRQRELVEREAERLGALRQALDDAIDAEQKGTTMPESAMFEGFDPAEYDDEARARWGDTAAYRESTRRAATYGETEWREIRAEWDAIVAELAAGRRTPSPARHALVLRLPAGDAPGSRDDVGRGSAVCRELRQRRTRAQHLRPPRVRSERPRA